MEDENDVERPRPMGLVAVVVPMLTAGVSGLLGVGLGVVATLLLRPAAAPEPTVAQVGALCAPEVAAKQAEVEAAQDEVTRLSGEVRSHEAKVASLEDEMARRNERGRAVWRELEAARAELAAARENLAIAYAEQERLRGELEVTVEKLAATEEALTEQVQLTSLATDDALVNRWGRFVQDAQLEICERGNRKKLGKCREIVDAKVGNDRVRDTFEHCVRARAATPSVHELARDASLPRYAVFVDQEDRVVEGWYVQFCDPTLPEAEFFSDARSARPAAAAGAVHASVLDLGLDD
jgi:hypothetical protein